MHGSEGGESPDMALLYPYRHKDENARFGIAPESSDGVTGKLPSMALDTRFPAGMTTLELFRKNDRLKHKSLLLREKVAFVYSPRDYL